LATVLDALTVFSIALFYQMERSFFVTNRRQMPARIWQAVLIFYLAVLDWRGSGGEIFSGCYAKADNRMAAPSPLERT
jgi:hypothetical protein